MKNKTLVIIQEYAQTTVLVGSKGLFAFFFWATKVFSFLQHKSNLLNGLLHKISRVLPKPSFIIQNKSGVFIVKAFDDSTTICSEYFEKELRGWLITPSNRDVFIDIGANRGIYTVLAPTRAEYKEVHAFEPNPEVVTILKKNIELNHLEKRVKVHHTALGETEGSLSFVCDPMHLGGGRIVTEKTADSIEVPVQVFDKLATSIPLERISFIKIDTEGFEFSVLKGMSNTLTLMRAGSCLMIESTEHQKLATILDPFGFKRVETKNHDHLFQKYA